MSGKAHPPDLKKYMDKRISRVLRGFDPFMNLVIDDAFDEISAKERNSIGMVVIRGNSIVMLEALERINNMA